MCHGRSAVRTRWGWRPCRQSVVGCWKGRRVEVTWGFWGCGICYSAPQACTMSEESGLLPGRSWRHTTVFSGKCHVVGTPHQMLSCVPRSPARAETSVLSPFLGSPSLSYLPWGHFFDPILTDSLDLFKSMCIKCIKFLIRSKAKASCLSLLMLWIPRHLKALNQN